MAARTELQKLYHQLCETRFSFIPPGEYDIRDVYALVQDRFPELCDDSYLCSENCKSGYNSPEWKHKVRTALWDTKRRTDEVRSGTERGAWLFGVNLRMARSWREAVLDALTRLGTGHTAVIDRKTLITEELNRIVGETASRGATPEHSAFAAFTTRFLSLGIGPSLMISVS